MKDETTGATFAVKKGSENGTKILEVMTNIISSCRLACRYIFKNIVYKRARYT